jgi:hypothetical protein
LWGDQGRRTEARNLLVPVYDWFTEGLDTPDLKDAKALLPEFSGNCGDKCKSDAPQAISDSAG